MSLGKEIRRLRDEQGMTQEELAAASGVSRVSVQKYEADVNRPPLDVAVRLADALGVCVDQLARGGEKCPLADDDAIASLARRIHRLDRRDLKALTRVVEAMEENAGWEGDK